MLKVVLWTDDMQHPVMIHICIVETDRETADITSRARAVIYT